MTTTTTTSEGGLLPSILAVAGTGLVAAVVATPYLGVVFGGGVAIGAGIAIVNLLVLGRVVRAFVTGSAALPWAALATVKMLLLFGGVFLLIDGGVSEPFSLMTGYAALPLGLVIAQMLFVNEDASPARSTRARAERERASRSRS